MDYFSAFATSDGLDSDVARILGQILLQEFERGVMVTVGRFHAEKYPRHTPKSSQLQSKHTRIPRYPPVHQVHQRNN